MIIQHGIWVFVTKARLMCDLRHILDSARQRRRSKGRGTLNSPSELKTLFRSTARTSKVETFQIILSTADSISIISIGVLLNLIDERPLK